MKEHKSKVGKNLIGMLMFQMYGDSKLIYREYIQNARDAINDAVKEGVLSNITEGHITVNIDSTNRIIIITDNGTGISVAKVEPVLLDIADSDKDGETSAGQFGIGRLVGGYFCKKLTFKTSYKGEDVASEIIFDIDKIKAILDDETDHRTATEVIDAATEINLYEAKKDEHYFIVTLEDIHPDYPELLNQEIISEYLKEVAPVDYNPAFKNQLIQTNIHDEYIDFQQQVGHFRISVNDEVSIKKRYGLNIEGTGDQIISLNYFSLPDDTHGLLAWGWYAVTEFSIAIPRSDRNRGFRLRKHNIQVGDATLLSDLFPKNENRGNTYFYGEIHIANQRIKLNSARDGLAPTPEAECLKQRIRDYFDHLKKLYHLANDMKKATEKAIEANADQTTTHTTDMPEVTKKWDEATKKIASIENSKNAQSVAAKQIIESYKQKISEAVKTSSYPQPTRTETTSVSPIVSTQPKTDLFAALKGSFSEDKIELIKRIFNSFTDNCPIAQKKLIDELKKKVIKDLGK